MNPKFLKKGCWVFCFLLQMGGFADFANASEYFPIPTRGNVREYDVVVAVSNSLHHLTMTESHDLEKMLQGQVYFKRILNPSERTMRPRIDFVRFDENGVFIIENNAQQRPEYLEVPFPLTQGKEWSYTNTAGIVRCEVETIG